MKFLREMIRLYAVTDRRWLGEMSLCEAVEQAIRGGVTMVQLREKHLAEEKLIEEAKDMVKLCHRYAIPLLIDDDVHACLISGADGVHVGQSDMAVAEARKILGPDAIIGATAHNVSEAVEAERQGADYLGCGAAFGSSTKKDASAIDRDEYRRITSSVRIPVCAIGGINQGNISRLRGFGLGGAAIISGIFGEPDIQGACENLLPLCRQL